MKYGESNNTNPYLNTNSYYWTMTSGYYVSNTRMYVVTNGMAIWPTSGGANNSIRPVINLKSSTLFEPGGTSLANNPYVVLGN